MALDSEVAWNSEVGLRVVGSPWIRAELAAFRLDFQRQVVPPTESMSEQDGVNSGQSVHQGVELGLWLDPGRAAGWGVELPVQFSGTLLDTRLGTGWDDSVQGNVSPYAPTAQLTAALGAWTPAGIGVQVRAQHVGAQVADRANTVTPSIDGTLGRLPAYTILDARAAWRHRRTGLELGVTAKNLLDATYIASRAPRGIQVGPRRHVMVSVGWSG